MKFRAAILSVIFLILTLGFLISQTNGTKLLIDRIPAVKLSHSQQGDELELELVVEVSRHGERASKKIFNLTAEGAENFQVGSKELTKTGAESHHAIGHQLKVEFDAFGLINTAQYSVKEVYV